MPAITKDPVATAPSIVCVYCHRTQGLRTSPQKLSSSISPEVPILYPVGCCIHASVATMKNPEIHDPIHTAAAANQCATGRINFSPNRNRPRKLDSRKNEYTPSIARVCPMTPPADFENRDQFVPN